MKIIFKKVLPFLVVLFLILAPMVVLKADFSPCAEGTGKLCNPLGDITELKDLIKKILIAVVKIGIPLVVLAIIYSGFLFVTAMGNSEKLTKAKDAFIWSLIGGAVLLGSWAIAELIITTVKEIK